MYGESTIPAETVARFSAVRSSAEAVLAVANRRSRAWKIRTTRAAKRAGICWMQDARKRDFHYAGLPISVVTRLLTKFHLPRSTLLAFSVRFAGRDTFSQRIAMRSRQGPFLTVTVTVCWIRQAFCREL